MPVVSPEIPDSSFAKAKRPSSTNFRNDGFAPHSMSFRDDVLLTILVKQQTTKQQIMPLTAQNMLSSGVTLTTNQTTTRLTSSGNSLTTGQKSNIDVTSYFMANGLRDSSSIGAKIVESIGYGINAIKIGLGSLETMANTLIGMKSAVALSSGETFTSLVSLNNVLNNNVNLLNTQINNTEFNGAKLLTGNVGKNPTLTDKYDTKPVNVRSVPTTAQFQGTGRRSFIDIIITNNNDVNFGDTVIVGNVTFTIVSGAPANENEVQKGVDAAGTASNLATAILNNSTEFLRNYDVGVTGNAVNITERTISGNIISTLINSPAGGVISQIPKPQDVVFTANPADGDTITIAGQIFTFRNAPAAPNDVQIGGTEFLTINNLITAINVTNPTTSALVNNGRMYVDANGNTLRLVAGAEVPAVTVSGPPLIVATDLYQIIYTNTAVAGTDSVTIAGVTFNYVNAVVNPTDVATGGSADQSCTNLYNAILADPVTAGLIASNDLQVSDDGFGTLSIYQTSNVPQIPNVTSPGGEIDAPADVSKYLQFAAAGGVSLAGIRDIDSFIGFENATIEVIGYAVSGGGNNAASNLVTNSGFTLAAGIIPANGDAAAIISITIAGYQFTGYVFKPNGINLNDKTFVFTNYSTNQYFTINTSGNFNQDMSTLPNTQNNLITPIQNLLNGTLFDQTRDLTITTDGGNVIVNGGVVASVTGMTAELNSTNFTGKAIDDFQITSDNLGNITFTATINGANYTNTIAAANIGILVQGYALNLTNISNSDVLTINLGVGGLTNLNVIANIAPIATAIRNTLMNVGSGLQIRTGVSSDEVIVVKMPNVSLEKIFVDNTGVYLPQFDLTTPAGRQKADEVLTNALAIVRDAQAILKNSGDTVDMATAALQNFIQLTSDAAGNYADTDLIESAEEFSKALKALSSAILVLKGGSTIASQAQKIISNVVNVA